jgi:hypothetical protein
MAAVAAPLVESFGTSVAAAEVPPELAELRLTRRTLTAPDVFWVPENPRRRILTILDALPVMVKISVALLAEENATAEVAE